MKKIISYKKGFILSIIAIIGLIVITAGVTYAFFNYTKQGTTENSLTSGSITFHYTEVSGVGKGISIEDAMPMSDEQGKVQTGEGKVFDFKVTSNTMNHTTIEYEVTARKKTDSTLDESAVKLFLTKVSGNIEEEILLDNYSNLEQTTKVSADKYIEKTIYNGRVYANTANYEQAFKLRMWLDEEVDFSPITDEEGNETYPYSGKTFTLMVNVYANAKVITDEEVSLENSTEVLAITADGEKLEEVETEEYDYKITLPNGTESTSIEVVPENENAEVTVEKSDSLAYNSNIKRLAATTIYGLQTGNNYFKVTVVSENKKNVKEIKLNIEVEKENINTLENLEVTGYEITPEFSKEVSSYEVTTEETNLEIVAEPTSSLSTVSVTGNEKLSWGSNEVTVMVTAEDGTVKIYKITVNNNRPTAPTITGGSTSWVTTAPTIKVSTAGSAVSGIKHYEYYKSTTSTAPTDSTTATGTTSGNLTISDEGTSYVWYRTVSNNGYKSSWSTSQTVKLDTGTPSAPTITGGSTSWSSSAKTISVSTAASATSGISYYQYCISTSTSSCNGTWTNLASGTTSVSISTNGIRYIYFRGVSGAGTTGTASAYQTTKVDTAYPSLSVSVSGKVATLTIGDNIGVVGYGVSTGTTISSYTPITSTTSTKITWTATAAGTYYAHIIDNAGRAVNVPFTIASTAFCAYAPGDVVQTFNYSTSGVQTFTTPCSGTYKLEVWGAAGGNLNGSSSITGGKGGYSYGNKTLTSGTKLYVAVGGQGGTGSISTTTIAGGYNGGGAGGDQGTRYHSGGGGATHIATTNRGVLTNYASYKTEILIVAGGGGGCGGIEPDNTEEPTYSVGGSGGGTSGGTANRRDGIYQAYGGSQTAGGVSTYEGSQSTDAWDGSFGLGGSATHYGGGGGGGGYYGGAASCYNGGGGGSGYIGGVTGGSMSNGQRSGNGMARITLVSLN